MLITKLNLYKNDWLDLVFADRNKGYGAYDLRRNYAQNLAKAMIITFVSFAAALAAYSYWGNNGDKGNYLPPSVTDSAIVIDILKPKPPVEDKIIEHPKPEQPKPETPKPKPAAPRQTIAIPIHVTSEEVTTDPPIIANITGAIGPVNTDGPETGENILPDKGEGTGNGTGTATTGTEVYDANMGLTVMPEPVGGNKAWAKFLQKNLKYPYSAQEQGVSGKVYLSFIIEKDGHLSDIKLVRKAGWGFDEEALRVLKIAPAWKPGIQNGAPVRVRYTIPINFQINY